MFKKLSKFLNEYKLVLLIVLLSKLLIFVVFPFIFANVFKVERAMTLNPIDLWNVWDTPHYLEIAANGYQLSGDASNFIVFLPLFPIIIKITSLLLQTSSLFSGYIVSGISSFILAIYLYKLVLLDYPKKIAILSVLFLFIFPTSIFLHIAYTESLFLALVISSFYYLRLKKYFPAFILISLAGLTKNMIFALIPALMLEIWIKERKIYLEKPLYLLSLILIGLSGFFVYLLLNYYLFGNLLYFVSIEKLHWYTNFSPMGEGLFQAINSYFWRTGVEKYTLSIVQVISFFIALAVGIFTFFKIRKSYGVYMIFSLFLYYSMSFWLSMPRYLVSFFPLFIFLAFSSKYKLLKYICISISFCLMTAVSLILAGHGPIY